MLSAMQDKIFISRPTRIKCICKVKFNAAQKTYALFRVSSTVTHIFRDLCYFACAYTKPSHVLIVNWRQCYWYVVNWSKCIPKINKFNFAHNSLKSHKRWIWFLFIVLKVYVHLVSNTLDHGGRCQ